MNFPIHSKRDYSFTRCQSSKLMRKPTFVYFTPITIHDEDFPEEISQQTNNSTLLQVPSIAYSQQTSYDAENMRHIAGLKFNKSSFVKLKNHSYKKNYVVSLNSIGKGAFGIVRKVQSVISKQYRAAKCINKKRIKNLQLQKLLKQVHIMMQLDHPNIANILEVYDYQNQFTLICEYCQGGDLMKCLRSSQKNMISEKIVANIIKQLLRTVIYLHNNSIVHRDIKPQNILFQKRGSHSIKLIDFGIATKLQPKKKLDQRVGTPAYMAPQLFCDKYNQKVDVWAVGITMYQLLSGRIPFIGESVREIIGNISKKEVEFYGQPWRRVTPGCIQVLKLMTRKNYRQRPSAKQIFQHAYFQQITDQDLSTQQKDDFTNMMRKFQFKNKLQAAIQTFIVSQLLSLQQKNQLVDFFRQFDRNNDGVISTQQLKQVLSQRKRISGERIDTLMNIIDTNGSGKIDYTEFLAAGFLDAKSFTIQRLKQAFKHFDSNRDGKISVEEVMEFMKVLDNEGEDLRKLFDEFDANKDGFISEDQFIAIMLERSKNINLEKLKTSTTNDLHSKRIDKTILGKLCEDFIVTNKNQNPQKILRNLTNQRKSKKKK